MDQTELTRKEVKELALVIVNIKAIDRTMKAVRVMTGDRQKVFFHKKYRYKFLEAVDYYFTRHKHPTVGHLTSLSVRMPNVTIKLSRSDF